MKKLALLAAIALMGVSAWAQTVSVVALNNFDPDRPIFYLAPGTPAPTGKGINVQLFGGPVGGTLAPVASTDGLNTFQILADGYFDAGLGIVPGVTPAGGQAQFELRAWEGASWEAAQAGGNAGKVTWQQATTSWDSTPPNPPPGSPAALQIPTGGLTITVVPEPSTIALGLLGAAALLIRRRK